MSDIGYQSGLTLGEVETHYNEVLSEFKSIKSRYSGVFSVFKRNLSLEDQLNLIKCRKVTLNLWMEPSVRNQFRAEHLNGNYQDSLHYKIGELNSDISKYFKKYDILAKIMSNGHFRNL